MNDYRNDLAQAERDVVAARRRLPAAIASLSASTPTGWPTSSRPSDGSSTEVSRPTENAALAGLHQRTLYAEITDLVAFVAHKAKLLAERDKANAKHPIAVEENWLAAVEERWIARKGADFSRLLERDPSLTPKQLADSINAAASPYKEFGTEAESCGREACGAGWDFDKGQWCECREQATA